MHHDSPILPPLPTTYTLPTNFLHPVCQLFHTGHATADLTLNTHFREKWQLWTIAVCLTGELFCPCRWQKGGDSPLSPSWLTPCSAPTECSAAKRGIPHSPLTAAEPLEGRALGNDMYALLRQHEDLSPCCPPQPHPAAGFQPVEAL